MHDNITELPLEESGLGPVTFSTTRNIIRLALAVSLLLLACVGLVAYRNTQNLVQMDADVARTQETRAEIASVLDAATDVQVSARSYVLSITAANRRDWEDARLRLSRETARLQHLAHSQGDEERDAIARYVALTDEGANRTESLLKERERGRFSSARITELLRDEGITIEGLRRAARRLSAQEEALLPPRIEAAARFAYQTQQTVLAGGIAAVCVVAGAIAMIDRDMRKRKIVEAQLAASERRFRAIIENASDLITVLNADGSVQYDSPSAVRMVGETAESAIGKFPLDRVHPDDRAMMTEALERVKRSRGVNTPVGFRFRAADGSYRWLEAVASNQLEVPGVRGIVLTTRDVTDRRQAEEAIREGAERLREVQRLAGLGSWEYNLTSGQITWTDEVYRLFGVDPANGPLDFDTYFSRVHPAQRDAARARIAQAIENATSFEFDSTVLWPDGTVRHAHGTMKAERDSATGAVVRLMGTVIDITARVEAERAREAIVAELKASDRKLRETAEELARSNRELSMFATVASHDLQEPLRKIRTFADMIERRTEGKLDAATNDYLKRMKQASERLSRLVEAVLELSRASTRPRKPIPVDLRQAMNDVLSDLEPRIERTRGVVEIVDPLPRIEADPVQIRQLLQNLVGNALKFHQPETPPRVTVQSEVIASPVIDDTRRWLRLTVTDDGIGFEPEYAERIFQVFERLEGRSDYEGNGVGLSLCRRIVERHGGSISAEGVPGKGARFTILLPGALDEVTSSEPPAAMTPSDSEREQELSVDSQPVSVG